MDLGTIAGIVAAFVFVAGAILLGGDARAFWSPSSILIVLGGTLSTAFIMFPAGRVLGAFKVAMKAFRVKHVAPEKLIGRIVELSEVVRREGLLALENEEIDHEFLQRGVNLAIDGTEPDAIDSMLQTEIHYVQRRHQSGQKIFRSLGETAPAFGMIGTLIGLVQMLRSLSDPASIGPAMAVALLTTLYGSVLANLIFLPIAKKLENRSAEETLALMIIATSIRSVTNGDYPRRTRERLEAFLAGSQRTPDEPEQPAGGGGGEATGEGGEESAAA